MLCKHECMDLTFPTPTKFHLPPPNINIDTTCVVQQTSTPRLDWYCSPKPSEDTHPNTCIAGIYTFTDTRQLGSLIPLYSCWYSMGGYHFF
jgi:hypothetical protein